MALSALMYASNTSAQNEVTLHDSDGKSINVPTRKALPVDARRARYPGFKQESIVLKAGSVRREGAKPLTCDILLERDVPVTLRDGVTIIPMFSDLWPKADTPPSWHGAHTGKRSAARCSMTFPDVPVCR